MEAVQEGTADDDANLSRKKPPESTQKMKKTPSSSRVLNDPRMFEEETLMIRNWAIWVTVMMRVQKPTFIMKGSLSEKCWSHPMNQLEMMQTTLTI